MTSFPDWVHTLTDTDLTRRFGALTVARGSQYATLGRVGRIQTAGTLATAPVRGSAMRTYQVSVNLSQGNLVATCSCPMRFDCKHAVALVQRMRHPGNHPSALGWRSLLQPLVDQPQERQRTPLGVQIDTAGSDLVLRLMRLGMRGTWVKAGATWQSIGTSVQFPRAQALALAAVYDARDSSRGSALSPGDTLGFHDTTGSLWTALRRAVDAGVELLPGTSPTGRPLATPSLLNTPLEPTLLVRGTDTGALTLHPAVVLDGEVIAVPGRDFIGRPAHGVSLTHDDDLVLAALSRPLDSAEQRVFGHGSLTIPQDEVDSFLGFLPQLRQRLTVSVDPTLDLPEPDAPTLVCRVGFSDKAATLQWGFRYRIGERAIDIPVGAGQSEHPRDRRTEAAVVASLPPGPWLDPNGNVTQTELVGRDVISFVTETLPVLQALDGVEVELADAAPTFVAAGEAPSVSLQVTDSPSGDWFDLEVEITVGGEPVPLGALLLALAAGDDHLVLDSGTWFPLDAAELDPLKQLLDEANLLLERDGDTFRLHPEHAGWWEELVALGVVTSQSQTWRSAVAALLDPSSLPGDQLPDRLQADLRAYQETGASWLSFLWRARLGGILADEMGLGKTLQALAAIQGAHERDELTRPVLVVAPTSVIGTWAAEAARFAPELRVETITETQSRRGVELSEVTADAHVVITSYTLLRLEEEAYIGLDWAAVLLDEAQFVKNHASKAYRAVRRLKADVKVALTGTPLENNLMDLWSLLSITSPGLFPDPKAFTTAFRKPIEAGNAEALARLHRRIRPLILRRTKVAVATELPDKQEQVVPVELAPAHRRLYDRHLARERQKVLGLVGDLNRNRITILRSLTLLRQLSLAPSLIDPTYPAQSAKIDALVEMLGEVIAEGHRALVFSQFTSFLSLVKERLDTEGVRYEYLDGRTRDRAKRIAAFREGDAPAFLISLKAGGFGLTLTEADYVFILDPWWNPAAENQAIDRTHRIGQDQPVNVYRLVSANTIEEKVVALQQRKRDLFAQVVGTDSDTAAPLGADDIRGLLD